MIAKAYLIPLLVLVAALPAFSQVEPSATGGGATTEDDTQMMTPPPVSGMPYMSGAADTRSNYLDMSISGNAGYDDNVLLGAEVVQPSGQGNSATGDETYWIDPSITLRKSRGQQLVTLGYTPSFTFYQHTSELDAANQAASVTFHGLLSPHVSLSVDDFFVRTNDVFSESYPFSSGNLTGTTQGPVPALIVPYAEQMSDTANGSVDYQFSSNSMLGGGASYSTFSFINPSAAAGLSNSDGEGGSAFFSRRFSGKQYGGVSYNYARDVATDAPEPPFTTQLHTILPFYSVYFTPKFSLSISSGIQHVDISQLTVAQGYSQWSAVGTASLGWQGNRGSFDLSYLHSIESGEGLAEAITSDAASASGSWKMTRTWTSTFEASYVNSSPVTTRVAFVTYGYEGGNTLTLGATLTHTITEHILVGGGYDRLQENYPGIPLVAAEPNSDRVFATFSYVLSKPIGR